MVDVMSVEKRSALMSRVGAKNTAPEIAVRQRLWQSGFRYRLHDSKLPGKPDLILPKWHAVIFVHGCFWHQHEGCPYFRLPATRTEFWVEKLRRNKQRDDEVTTSLLEKGWRVAVVWECAIRANAESAGDLLMKWLRRGSTPIEVWGDKAKTCHSSPIRAST
ncbi:MAG: DNA mismatch endonuclease Vsr [Alphaproteobacteria bacterium]|nr:DNA mismatch endonuclease Vsr [Alphaproteobacteria bacterium]